MQIRQLAAAAVLALIPAGTMGQIVPISQNRSLDTRAQGEGEVESDFRAAAGFGHFGGSLVSTRTFSNGNTARGTADQTSFIGAHRITGAGATTAMAESPSAGSAQGNGVSLFSASFELTDSVPARLEWTITASAPIDAKANVALIGPGGLILLRGVGEASRDGLLFDSGVFEETLEPGLYSLEALSTADSYSFNGLDGEPADATWDFRLTVPAPATPLAFGLATIAAAHRRRR